MAGTTRGLTWAVCKSGMQMCRHVEGKAEDKCGN